MHSIANNTTKILFSCNPLRGTGSPKLPKRPKAVQQRKSGEGDIKHNPNRTTESQSWGLIWIAGIRWSLYIHLEELGKSVNRPKWQTCRSGRLAWCQRGPHRSSRMCPVFLKESMTERGSYSPNNIQGVEWNLLINWSQKWGWKNLVDMKGRNYFG